MGTTVQWAVGLQGLAPCTEELPRNPFGLHKNLIQDDRRVCGLGTPVSIRGGHREVSTLGGGDTGTPVSTLRVENPGTPGAIFFSKVFKKYEQISTAVMQIPKFSPAALKLKNLLSFSIRSIN